MAFTKNTAVTGFTFGLVNKTTGAAVTSGTVTGYYTLDGGTQATLSGTPVHEGNGQWSINLTAAEMNGDIVGLIFVHSDAIPKQITIRTTTASAASQAGTPGTVDSVTLYCSEADVDFVWSSFGVDVRADDDANGIADDGVVNLAIQRASLLVNRYVLHRYTVAACQASTWLRWATAYIAAEVLGKRRGNSIPESLASEVAEYFQELERIKTGQDHLMGDSGPSTPRYDSRPIVSNMTVDPRYARNKVRRVPSTSTGPGNTQDTKRNDEQYYG